jgi:hypothetical protein
MPVRQHPFFAHSTAHAIHTEPCNTIQICRLTSIKCADSLEVVLIRVNLRFYWTLQLKINDFSCCETGFLTYPNGTIAKSGKSGKGTLYADR